ncbi:DegT/DnrJ/EryC1/StrS family aminotransferase [Spirosoma fluminis]
MIPRFTTSFSIRDAWGAVGALFADELPGMPLYRHLFPVATTYEISSARAGMAYALRALQLKPGACVGVQPYTCSSVMNAIRTAGFRPVFIDVDETLTLDANDLVRKVTHLDALVVTYTFGRLANVEQIRASTGNIPVIEDCAHAFGTRYEGVAVGNFFDMAVFSFGPGKFPALGGGGLLVVNNRQYVQSVSEQVRPLKPIPMPGELAFMGRQLISSLLYSRVGYGLMYRLFKARLMNRGKQPDDQADLGNAMPRAVQWWLRSHADRIEAAFAKQRRNALMIISKHNATFRFIQNQGPNSGCFALVCVTESRDALFDHLVDSGISAGKHFQYAPLWASQFGYQRGDCPTFDRLVEQIITIPCHDALTPGEVAHIDESLARFANSNVFKQKLPSFS